jgi:hypothetical protein
MLCWVRQYDVRSFWWHAFACIGIHMAKRFCVSLCEAQSLWRRRCNELLFGYTLLLQLDVGLYFSVYPYSVIKKTFYWLFHHLIVSYSVRDHLYFSFWYETSIKIPTSSHKWSRNGYYRRTHWITWQSAVDVYFTRLFMVLGPSGVTRVSRVAFVAHVWRQCSPPPVAVSVTSLRSPHVDLSRASINALECGSE